MIVAPGELVQRPQWVAWKLDYREGEPKPTKVPYNAHTGRKASTTDPRTWATFEEATAFWMSHDWTAGVGYVLSPEDPFVGVDLDGCRDPETSWIEDWAARIVKRLNSYTEVSPSGKGLRIFVRGTLPPHGRKKGAIEMYSHARFLTITGDHLSGYPEIIHSRTSEILAVHLEVFGPQPEPHTNGTAARAAINLSDNDLLTKAISAQNGPVVRALWNGDYTAYKSQSEADAALMRYLAFWTGPDESRLISMVRSSGLMREKWERPDYQHSTYELAVSGMTEFYSPPSMQLVAPASVPGQTVDLATGEVQQSAWQSLYELVHSTPERTAEVVQGLIWSGRTHWVYSAPGAGKTIFILAALMHVAAGRLFCGRATEQRSVLIIEEDSPLAVVAEYVAMLADIYEIDLESLPFWINRSQGFRLSDTGSTTAIMDAILTAPQWPGVVVLDACERIVPSDRFSSKEIDPLSSLLQKLAAMNVSNIVIDHTRKTSAATADADPLDLLYGGRTKSAISDVMIYFSGRISDSARVTFTKFRGQTPAPFDIGFDAASGFRMRTQRRDLSDTERQIMRALNSTPGAWMTKDDVCDKVNGAAKTIERALLKLVTEDMVERAEALRPARFRALSSGINFTV